MQRTSTTLLLLLLIYSGLFAQTRDITGVWQGHFRSNNGLPKKYFPEDDRYKFEVQIAQHDKSFQAITYSYQSTNFYGKADADGTLNAKTGKVLLQEIKITEMRMQHGSDACIMTCFLQYSKSGDDEFLEGTYVSMNIRDSSNCGKGTVFLRKSAGSDFYKEPFLVKKEEQIAAKDKTPGIPEKKTPTVQPPGAQSLAKNIRPAPVTTNKPAPGPAKPAPLPAKPATETKAPAAKKPVITLKTPVPTPAARPRRGPPVAARTPVKEPLPSIVTADTASESGKIVKRTIPMPLTVPKVLTSRANEIVQTIHVSSNEVTLHIYDNGAIDHDTISVYLDKRLVVAHAMLTEQPIIVKLHLDEANDYHELVMVADNEGDIPPNTSLMVVKAGDKEYEVRIASSEQKNAVVIFRYEKKP